VFMNVVDFDCEIIPTFVKDQSFSHLILCLSKGLEKPTTNKFFESLKLQKLKPSSSFFF
jgi:hypothetical protein